MDSLTLRQLRYFDALARHGHFGRAADACAISQPALSVQIKELEQSLGAPLFERGPRHVRLTGFGAEWGMRVKDILRAIDELGEMARAAQRGFGGRLRIGIIPTIAPYLLPRLISQLAIDHPELDIHIRETITPSLIDELGQGQIDTAIVALPVDEPGFIEVPLFDEALMLVRPRKDAGLPVPQPEALRQMRLLMLEEGHCFRDQALSFCDLGSGQLRDGLDGTSLATLVQMVGAGIGVTLIPEIAVPVETRSAPVHVAHFAQPTPKRTVGMIWRGTNPLAAQLSDLAALVGQVGQQLPRTA